MIAIDALLQVGSFAVGSLGLVAFCRSILRNTWLNNRQRDWIAANVANVVRTMFVRRARRCRSSADIQKLMAWAFPIYNFALVAVWFLLVQLSFAFLIWAVDADRTLIQAFISSGSALSTLGFDTPPSVVGRLLAIVEGAVGLGIIVFLFTFIPGYQAAVQARERNVGWLYAREGAQPTAFSLVEWWGQANRTADLTPLWATGESWFRGILESHSLTPLLAFVPSMYEGRTWVGAATALLDATSFAMSSMDASHVASARVCRQTGLDALHAIARALPGTSIDERTMESDAQQIMAGYDAAYDAFVSAGVALRPNREECRAAFLALRSEYESLVRGIATATLMPLERPHARG